MPILPASIGPASSRPCWLPGLVLALVGFSVWTLFSLWPWLTGSAAPFRIREAWDTGLFWRVGVPLMLVAQAAGGALTDGKVLVQPVWMLGGLLAGVVLVHPAGSNFGLLPLTVVLVGLPSYVALLAATAVGRAVGDVFE
jgi:hypothetical protein